MKTKTIKKVWESYEQKWMSKDFSDLIMNVDGKICVRFFNGTVGAVP